MFHDAQHKYLDHVCFEGEDLSHSNFSSCVSEYLIFREANLWLSDMKHGRFLHADFSKANLQQTDFSFADLSDAKFDNSSLYGAKFYGAVLKNTGLILYEDDVFRCIVSKTDMFATMIFEGTDYHKNYLGQIQPNWLRLNYNAIMQDQSRAESDISAKIQEIMAPATFAEANAMWRTLIDLLNKLYPDAL